jgi:ABC-type lipoprotein release transport system permease subunit
LRRRWASSIAVACIVALVGGTVLVLVAAARRTSSAPDRYTASVGGEVSALVEQRSGRPASDRIAVLPSVEQIGAYTFVFGGFRDTSREMPENLIMFTGSRPLSSRLIEGRDPDPDNAREFVADASFVDAVHARVGDTFPFGSVSREQIESGQGFNVEPRGASFDAVLVGVIDSPDRFGSDFTVGIFSKALLDEDVGIAATEMQLRLRDGASLQQLRTELDRLPEGTELSVERGRVVSEDIRHAVDAQARGLWIMTAVMAIAAMITLGQLLTRHVRLGDHERAALHAIGYTRAQQSVERLTGAALPAIAGMLVGAGLASLVSGIFPTGFVQMIEPHPGMRPDVVAFVLAAIPLVLAVLCWVGIAVANDQRVRASAGRGGQFARIAEWSPSPTAAIGARFALMRREPRGDSTYGTVAVLAAIVALLVGATAFATSLDRLVSDRERFGRNYNFALGDDGSDHTPTELRAQFGRDPDITGLMILSEGNARVAGTTVTLDLVGVERVKGDLAPRVLSGRLPASPDEMALGRLSAESLRRGRGDSLELTGPNGRATYRVVGIVVVPGVGGNDGVGIGGIVTPEAFRRVQPQSSTNTAAIVLRAGAPRDAARRIAGGNAPDGGGVPGAIINIARVRSVPVLLAALLGGLAILTVMHALIVSIYNRRRDLAVLKALGADRSWIGRAVHWQASVLTALPLIIGIPVGVAAGATLFRAFVNRIGAVPDPTIPIVIVVAVVIGILVLANVTAMIPSRRARKLPAAKVLSDY